jgi:LmbE family N-acetylglucosaminyl deacetylase
MQELLIPAATRRATRLLCIGAHCDDVEIGCGGTLLKLLARGGAWDVTWAVFSGNAQRERELHASARRFLRRARSSRVLTFDFRESYFPSQYAAIKDALEALKQLPAPDVIFTHQRVDRHQDHRLLGDLTWNAFRNHLVLEYEIPKYEGGLPTPNAYVCLTATQAAAKTRTLLDCYASQRKRGWFSAQTFDAQMRLRGVEAAAASGWAEGFVMNKFTLS